MAIDGHPIHSRADEAHISKLSATVAEDAANRERIASELELARTVQERLFPKAAPQVAGLDLAGLCRPAQTVGGDYFDFFTTRSGLTGFAIGDIAGKGISAALLMASPQASLRAMAFSGFSNLSDLMAKLNALDVRRQSRQSLRYIFPLPL